MKTLIVGGGIAGCACALLLRQRGYTDITIVEKAPKFQHIGFLIALWGTGRDVLRTLGIEQDLVDKSDTIESDTIYSKGGRLLKQVTADELQLLDDTIVVRRSDLHQTLSQSLTDTIAIHFDTTCQAILQDGETVTVTLSDDTQDTYDLVIGADGINSSVRSLAFGTGFLHYYGWRVWMWWANQAPTATGPISYYGSGSLFATMPFFDTTVGYLFANVAPHSERHSPAAYTHDFAPEVQTLTTSLSADSDVYQDDLAYVEMTDWYKGRVVLLGDAQHAVSPIAGMGASMALEDAYVLIDELAKTDDIHGGLTAFAQRRDKRLKHFKNLTNRLNKWTMTSGLLGHIRNAVIPYVPVKYFSGIVQRFIDAKV